MRFRLSLEEEGPHKYVTPACQCDGTRKQCWDKGRKSRAEIISLRRPTPTRGKNKLMEKQLLRPGDHVTFTWVKVGGDFRQLQSPTD